MSLVFLFNRTKNQELNAEQYICENMTNCKLVDLIETFSKLNRFSKVIITLRFIVLQHIFSTCIIIGDLRQLPIYIRVLLKFSSTVVLVDDGISTFWFYRDRERNAYKKKLYFYTKYSDLLENLYFPSRFLIKQSLKRKALVNGKNTIFIGAPYVENEWISEGDYKKIIRKVIHKYNDRELVYFAHPKEKEKKFNGLGIKVIQSDGNLTELFRKYIRTNTIFISCFSSGLVDAFIFNRRSKFEYVKLPGYEHRSDEHLFGFNVERSVYSLFKDIGFKEFIG